MNGGKVQPPNQLKELRRLLQKASDLAAVLPDDDPVLRQSPADGIASARKLRTLLQAARAFDLTELRHDLNLSQAEFARHCGVTVRTLFSWEKGGAVDLRKLEELYSNLLAEGLI